jgi:hypothetical protein
MRAAELNRDLHTEIELSTSHHPEVIMYNCEGFSKATATFF